MTENSNGNAGQADRRRITAGFMYCSGSFFVYRLFYFIVMEEMAMKKKLISVLLAAGMCLTAACSTPTSAGSEEPKQESNAIEVEKNLFSVEVTIPASVLQEGVTQEDLDAKVTDGIKSITLNEDGSATYIMTKAKHKEMMEEMKKAVDEGIQDMISSGDYPDITGVTPSKDYRTFTVHTTVHSEDELGFQLFCALGLYIYGAYYNAMNGTPADNITVQFTDPDGKVIAEGNSKDLGEDNS